MTIHQTTASVVAGGTVAAGLPLSRLNLRRVGYGVTAFELVAHVWQQFVTAKGDRWR